MHRLFISDVQYTSNTLNSTPSGTIELTPDQAHHYLTVLRLKPKTDIECLIQSTHSNSQSSIHQKKLIKANIHHIKQNTLTLTNIQESPLPSSTTPKLILCQALPKSDKMAEIIKKCTELGIDDILPFISKRCDIKTASNTKLTRWESTAFSAASQSKQTHIPTLHPITPSIDALNTYLNTHFNAAQHPHPILCCWEEEKSATLNQYLSKYPLTPASTLIILIGPEGGFAKEELEKLSHYQTVSLGTNILRVENAAFYVLAVVSNYFNG